MNDDTEWGVVDCPHCGERYERALDLSAGSHILIEDCFLCCGKIELSIETDSQGCLLRIASRRGKE